MKLCWSTLKVKDLNESVEFYEKFLDMKVSRRFQAGPDTEIAFLGDGETEIELICNRNKRDIDIGNDISWGFQVESLDRMMEFLTANSIRIIEGPYQPNPFIKFIYILDPNGMKLQLVEKKD